MHQQNYQQQHQLKQPLYLRDDSESSARAL
jgi:hypothetical protein